VAHPLPAPDARAVARVRAHQTRRRPAGVEPGARGIRCVPLHATGRRRSAPPPVEGFRSGRAHGAGRHRHRGPGLDIDGIATSSTTTCPTRPTATCTAWAARAARVGRHGHHARGARRGGPLHAIEKSIDIYIDNPLPADARRSPRNAAGLRRGGCATVGASPGARCPEHRGRSPGPLTPAGKSHLRVLSRRPGPHFVTQPDLAPSKHCRLAALSAWFEGPCRSDPGCSLALRSAGAGTGANHASKPTTMHDKTPKGPRPRGRLRGGEVGPRRAERHGSTRAASPDPGLRTAVLPTACAYSDVSR